MIRNTVSLTHFIVITALIAFSNASRLPKDPHYGGYPPRDINPNDLQRSASAAGFTRASGRSNSTSLSPSDFTRHRQSKRAPVTEENVKCGWNGCEEILTSQDSLREHLNEKHKGTTLSQWAVSSSGHNDSPTNFVSPTTSSFAGFTNANVRNSATAAEMDHLRQTQSQSVIHGMKTRKSSVGGGFSSMGSHPLQPYGAIPGYGVSSRQRSAMGDPPPTGPYQQQFGTTGGIAPYQQQFGTTGGIDPYQQQFDTTNSFFDTSSTFGGRKREAQHDERSVAPSSDRRQRYSTVDSTVHNTAHLEQYLMGTLPPANSMSSQASQPYGRRVSTAGDSATLSWKQKRSLNSSGISMNLIDADFERKLQQMTANKSCGFCKPTIFTRLSDFIEHMTTKHSDEYVTVSQKVLICQNCYKKGIFFAIPPNTPQLILERGTTLHRVLKHSGGNTSYCHYRRDDGEECFHEKGNYFTNHLQAHTGSTEMSVDKADFSLKFPIVKPDDNRYRCVLQHIIPGPTTFGSIKEFEQHYNEHSLD